jgi:hypothetical protein
LVKASVALSAVVASTSAAMAIAKAQ